MLRLPPPPALPRPPAPAAFPVIAVAAPLLGAVVIGLVTGSAFVLVFAVLSPLVAIATVVDGRRGARRHRRQEAERFDRECAAFARAVDRAHAAERAEAEARHPAIPVGVTDPSSPVVRVGTGPRPSATAVDGPLLVGEGPDEARLAALLERARVHPSLPILVPRGAIGVRGTGAAAAGLRARLALEPGCSVRVVPDDEPQDAAETLLVVRSALRVDVHLPQGSALTGRPDLLSRYQLAVLRHAVAAAEPPPPPPTVAWHALQPGESPDGVATGPGGIVIGHDGTASVALDLQRDGPHALVGGTTGSGKSEFLRTFALSWAASCSPRELQLLFVDFKGGATFSGLTGLPHAIGLITDLDPLIAERTLRGLRAELQRRERLLVEHGLRDAAEAPGVVPRLVVLVDEFATLIDTFPALHASFADLSARGRSLGVHLVLGTQHPAAAVRDAVAANCAVRIAFRLSESAGAAFVGASGRALAAAPPGRALVVTAEGEQTVQVAVADATDITAVTARWSGHTAGEGPWLPPLPAVVRAADIELLQDDDAEPLRSGLRFGMIDDPAALRRRVARWHPQTDGALAVVGGPGSGRTTALAALAADALAAGARLCALPADLPSAWAVLEALQDGSMPCDLLVADDLDLLVGDAAELAPDLLARWDAAVRSIRRYGGGALAAVGPASTARSLLGGRFAVRLLLRALDPDDHALAGAPRGLFDRTAPAGRGWWLDQQVQVLADRPLLEATPFPAVVWAPPLETATAVVSRRPRRAAVALEQALPGRTVLLGAPLPPTGLLPPPGAPGRSREGATIHVADPDEWQGAWASLAALRRSGPVLVLDAERADLRTLLGVRSVAPPISPERGEAWLLEPGAAPQRVRVPGLETS